MRRVYIAALVAFVTAPAACAADLGDASVPPPPSRVEGDAAVDIADAARDAGDGADVSTTECSIAGWCATGLPGDAPFTFNDVWPFEKTAFAVGFRAGDVRRGTIVEYDGEKWEPLAPLYDARVVWAPNENEIWAGGESYLGMSPLKRGVRSSDGWTWEELLPEASYVAGLWGSGPNDVYVLTSDSGGTFANRVYHVDATGTATLVFEVDAPSTLRIHRVIGTSSSDVWIIGQRQWCGYVAHKSKGTFETIIDGTPIFDEENRRFTCDAAGDAVPWAGRIHAHADAWPLLATAIAPREIAMAVPNVTSSGAGGRIYRARLTAEGGVEITAGVDFGATTLDQISNPRAIWTPAPGSVYVAGFGTVLRSTSAFDDAGSFSYSSVIIGKRSLDKQINAIRGTAPDNIWLVGDSHALHKTTH